jgi:hypothetical protein
VIVEKISQEAANGDRVANGGSGGNSAPAADDG